MKRGSPATPCPTSGFPDGKKAARLGWGKWQEGAGDNTLFQQQTERGEIRQALPWAAPRHWNSAKGLQGGLGGVKEGLLSGLTIAA